MRPILFVALMLAACTPRPDDRVAASEPAAPPPAPPSPAPSPPTHAAPPAVATLAGEWRVAGIDGRALDQPVGIALSADAAEIWWSPRCAGSVRSYRIAGSAFTPGPALGSVKRKPGDPTPPVCAIGLPPRLGEVFSALDAGRSIARTPANGVLIAGGGRSVLLFGQ